jgi:AAA+ ATPase superfamily predicted ATPase
MINDIIERQEEIKILQKTLQSKEAELVAITGRRRIGKTYLTNSVFQENMVFEVIGTQNASTEEQLQNFTNQLSQYYNSTLPLKKPDNWTEAFFMLRSYLQSVSLEEKKVIFFDELPWLAGQKSGFLSAFGYFWNSWASKQNLVIVICGSAASWMIQKVVNDKGGLHNRITQHIHLEPFKLLEKKKIL